MPSTGWKPSPTTILVVAFFLAAAAFVGSSIYSQMTLARLDATARSIADDVSLGIGHLTTSRIGIRRLERLVTRYVDGPSPESRREIEAAQTSVDIALGWYLAARPVDGEAELLARVHVADSAFQRVVDHAIEAADRGDLERARLLSTTLLPERSDAAVEAVSQAVLFNARAGRSLAQSITAQRHRATYLAMGLDSLSLALTILVASIALRFVKRHNALVAERRELAEVRANELEEFAGRVAHDIRGPMSSVALALEIARRKVAEPETVLRTLERASQTLKRAESITAGLLSFASAGAKPTLHASTDLGVLLRESLQELSPIAERDNVRLVWSPPSVSYRVVGSADILASVIYNLVQNAIKYMEGDERRVTVRALARQDHVRVEVQDTGPGVPRSLVGRIFDPHVQGRSHHGGIGLGLATVRRIVEAHGGSVGVASPAEGGSIFWFELPKASEIGTSPAASPERRRDPNGESGELRSAER